MVYDSDAVGISNSPGPLLSAQSCAPKEVGRIAVPTPRANSTDRVRTADRRSPGCLQSWSRLGISPGSNFSWGGTMRTSGGTGVVHGFRLLALSAVVLMLAGAFLSWGTSSCGGGCAGRTDERVGCGGFPIGDDSWTASGDNGTPIQYYTVTASTGDAWNVHNPATTSLKFDQLPDGIAYTFTVTATSAAGTSSASAPSNVAVPSASLAACGACLFWRGPDPGSHVLGHRPIRGHLWERELDSRSWRSHHYQHCEAGRRPDTGRRQRRCRSQRHDRRGRYIVMASKRVRQSHCRWWRHLQPRRCGVDGPI